MQDLVTRPKYMSAGALRGNGWDVSLSNPFFPRLKSNAYKGAGFEFGDRIPKAPAIGRPEIAITAERLQNAQIEEGLEAGPNRLTLGCSYPGLGGFFNDVGHFFGKVAAFPGTPFVGQFSMLLPARTRAKLFGLNASDSAKFETMNKAARGVVGAVGAMYVGNLAYAAAPTVSAGVLKSFPWLAPISSAIGKFIGKVPPGVLPSTQYKGSVSDQIPTQVGQSLSANAPYPDSPAPAQLSFGHEPQRQEASMFGGLPTWFFPVASGLLLVGFLFSKKSPGQPIVVRNNQRPRRRR